ncbi:glycosyltransferase [Aquihabitans sp. McL0605]|uniref:glycosyltransferase n=1 Tax=Aquihabitans sp. McL0605 TaxID=3415671 RepID=UPI003CE7CE19
MLDRPAPDEPPPDDSAPGDSSPDDAPPTAWPRVAYLVSRYPRLTETFVAGEMEAVLRAGIDVHLYPLHEERAHVEQPTTSSLAARVHHQPLLSSAVLAANGRALRRQPRTYLRTLASLIRHNLGSRRLLQGALAAFPVSVRLGEQFEDEEIEHVHAHFATHPAAAAYVINQLTGIPFSFTAHGSDIHRDQHMLAQKVAAAAFVVAVSESNREVVLAACREAGVRVPADRVVVVHCGIDPSDFPARPPRPRAPGDPLRAICVGTLHEVKGQAHLIEACRRARRAGVDVRLTLVGEGDDRAALHAQVEAAGLSEVVSFTGAVPQPRVRDLMNASDVLVTPSVPSADGRREGLPVVIVEAMAVGVPVVASRLSGIPEIVRDGDTGLLVDPGDRDGLTAALLRVDHDPGLVDALTARAHVLVATEFDADRSGLRLAQLFTGRTA